MRSLFFSVLTGLVGALVLHIVIVFMVPFFATGDAWSRLQDVPANTAFRPVEASANDDLITASTPTSQSDSAVLDDPVRTVVCRFDVNEAPVRLTANGEVPFWSLAVFDRRSNELFSMNDRTADDARLDVALAKPLHMLSLREAVPAPLSGSILVETPVEIGYVVLRSVISAPSWQPAAVDFMQSATCSPVPL